MASVQVNVIRRSAVFARYSRSFAKGQNLAPQWPCTPTAAPLSICGAASPIGGPGAGGRGTHPCVVFSCTKAVNVGGGTAARRARLREPRRPRRRLVAEFARHGKGGATLEHLLTHQVGLPAFDGPVTVAQAADPVAMADRLAGSTRNGSRHRLRLPRAHVRVADRRTGQTAHRCDGGAVRAGGVRFGSVDRGPGWTIARAARISVPKRGEPKSELTDIATQTRIGAAYAEPGSLISGPPRIRPRRTTTRCCSAAVGRPPGW